MTDRAAISSILSAGSILVTVPTHEAFAIDTGQKLASLDLMGTKTLFSLGPKTFLASSSLRVIVAHDTRTGEPLWSESTPWVSDLTVVHSHGAPVLCMQEVKKWGGGARVYRDPATGRRLEPSEVSAVLAAIAPQRTLHGHFDTPDAFISSDASSLQVHRVADGAVLAQIALDAPPSNATTTFDDGSSVTVLSNIQWGVPWRAFFGTDELMIATRDRLIVVRIATATARDVALPSGVRPMAVLDAARHGGRWRALASNADKTVDCLLIDDDSCRALWRDCRGVGVVRDRIVNASVELGAPETAAYTVALRAPSDPWKLPPIERIAGEIPADRGFIEALARLRLFSEDDSPMGLSLDTLRRLEEELGVVLPNWTLALLAANSTFLRKKLSISTDNMAGFQRELRDAKQQHLALPTERTRWIGLGPDVNSRAAFGRSSVTTKRIREGRFDPQYEYRITTFFCAGPRYVHPIERRHCEGSESQKPFTLVFEGGLSAVDPTAWITSFVAPLRARYVKSMAKKSLDESAVQANEERALREMPPLVLEASR